VGEILVLLPFVVPLSHLPSQDSGRSSCATPMDNSHSSTHENTATSTSASIALRRTSIPNINIAITRPHREPLAILDPQSAHSRLSDDSNHSTSSIHAYSQHQSDANDRDYNLDFSAYHIGRPILTHLTRSDEDYYSESVVSSSRKSSTATQ
jgi:hypothetical protein